MFENFKIAVQNQFDKLINHGAGNNKLFQTATDKDKIWDMYISSFPEGSDPKTGKMTLFHDKETGKTIEREATDHTCKACRQFLRPYGNIVGIINGKLESIWDIDPTGVEDYYVEVASKLSQYVKSQLVVDVFVTDEKNMGISHNHRQEEDGSITKFHHFHYKTPKSSFTSSESVASIQGEYRSTRQVFERALREIPMETLELATDLINQGSLLNGNTHLKAIENFKSLLKIYQKLENKNKDLWIWDIVSKFHPSTLRFKNTLIGVFCTELAEGEEINKACQSWNKRVDPVNYHKAKSPITQKQIKEAKKFVEENGYEESFDRRLATLDDIKVYEILHINRETGEKSVSVFDNIKTSSTRHKRSEFDKVEEIPIERFMKDILPTCTSVEALLLNSHSGNLVNITTAKNPNSKPIFKWDNNYSFTFNGNLAGKSEIKEAVKTAGGATDGVLRFSIMWADGDGDNSDLDAHCTTPSKKEIYFASSKDQKTQGELDIDIQTPNGKKAVENITFPSVERLEEGTYIFRVHQFAERQSKGFTAEIEFNGEVYQYEFPKRVIGYVNVAKVVFRNGSFEIEHILPSTESSKELWNLDTNNFHKVNMVCVTPNHWEDNNVGHKHYLFMLEECKNPNKVRGFHNEHLIPELLTHRKVMDVLGSTTLIEPTNNQLAGIGFNATVRSELILRLKGNFKRVIKLKF